MGVTVGDLDVKISANSTSLKSGLAAAEQESKKASENMTAQWKKFSDGLSNVGTKMSMFVTLPILAVGAASVKMASDMVETTNKVDVAFGDSAKAVKEWAETSIEQMGLAKQTALDSAALFGDMATGMGIASDKAAEMGEQLTQRAADLASYKNISMEIASTALASVYTGETESLKKLGVVMTEKNLTAYAMSQGIKENIADMTQQELVQLRLNFVMDATSNAQGDFARTSDGAANQMRISNEQVKELGANMGSLLLPAVVDVLGWVNKMIKGFTELPESQKKTIVTILAATAAIGPLIKIFGLLSKAGEVSQAIFKAFSATGFIGQMFASSAASTAQTAAATAAAAATKVQGATATATATQLSFFAAAETATAEGGVAAAAGTAAAAAGEAAAGVSAAAATPAVTGLGAALKFALGPLALIGTAIAVVLPLLSAMGDTADGSATQTKALCESVEASAEAFKKTTTDIETSAGANQKLSDELYALAASEDNSNVKKARMQMLVDQLNKNIPDLNLSIDENTGLLNKNVTAVNKSINAMKKQADQAAYSARYTELLKEQLELQLKETAAIKKRNDLQAEGIGVDPFGTRLAGLGEVLKSIEDYNGKLEINADDIAALDSAYADFTDTAAEMADTVVGSWENLTAAEQEALETLGVSAEEASAMTQGAVDSMVQSYNDNLTAMQENQAAIEEQTSQFMDDMGGIYDRGIEMNNTSAAQVEENLKKQTEQFTEWQSEIARLSSKVPESILADLESLGPGSTRLIKDLNKMNNEDLTSFVKTWQAKGKAAADAAATELGGMPEDTETVLGEVKTAIDNDSTLVASSTKVGVDLVQGMIDGMGSLGTALNNKASSLAKNAVAAMKLAIDSHSPAKATIKVGETFSEGFAVGMSNLAYMPIKAAQDISNASISALSAPATMNAQSYNTYNQQRSITATINAAPGNSQLESRRALWQLEREIIAAVG